MSQEKSQEESVLLLTKTYRPRAAKRQKLNIPVVVTLESGEPVASAHTLDFSTSGAKISIDRSIDLPARFRIALSERGEVSRLCQLVWRNASAMGVRFLQPAPQRRTPAKA